MDKQFQQNELTIANKQTKLMKLYVRRGSKKVK